VPRRKRKRRKKSAYVRKVSKSLGAEGLMYTIDGEEGSAGKLLLEYGGVRNTARVSTLGQRYRRGQGDVKEQDIIETRWSSGTGVQSTTRSINKPTSTEGLMIHTHLTQVDSSMWGIWKEKQMAGERKG